MAGHQSWADACSFRFYEVLRELSQPHPNSFLHVTPGKSIGYTNSYRERLQDAFLVLGPDDHLPTIAKILAQGKPSDEILQKLIRRVKKAETKIPLTDIAPNVVKKYNNRFASCNEPNCFNATLNWYDPKVGIKYTRPEEMEAALLKFFEPVDSLPKLRFGDTIVVRAPNGEILHTAIHLNRNILWHKSGFLKEYPWTFETFREAVEQYTDKYGLDLKIEFYHHK